MQMGMVGLGRMGANMVRRLIHGGHECVVFDVNTDAVNELVKREGRHRRVVARRLRRQAQTAAGRVDDGAGGGGRADGRGPVERFENDDIIVDGGNSYYIDDIRRAKRSRRRGLHYVDSGTSGGVWGLERGYCQMIGGETDV